ncbi:MAG: hypothetical protein EZS28_013981 [Streblomastix strix]|uniref:Uncharacterized protein n=1 Tax=Streblomastix strix TaxID=222440 RepID=A0A5J4W774_9EUKA|nr:MAG: hypothetical protein EZS28_013981 [Streblomastix strix]
MAIVPKVQKGKWQFSVEVRSPEEQMKIFADKVSKLQSSDEIPKKTRKRKYANDDDARQAIIYKKRIVHAKERQRLLDYKIVIPNIEELVQIHKMIDKYDDKVIKRQELMNIKDKDHAVFQKLGYIQENPNNSSDDDDANDCDRDCDDEE